MCKDFALNFDDKRTGCCVMTTHCLTLPFLPGNFLPKTTWLLSPTDPTLLFLRLKIKLKGCHFGTIAMIEAESQGALNTHAEHDFQDAFKQWVHTC
jgi:hypothetical protein